MTIVDDESPPGAWANEMKAAPWAYGQQKKVNVEQALWNIRKAGFLAEANTLATEISGLQAELERMTK